MYRDGRVLRDGITQPGLEIANVGHERPKTPKIQTSDTTLLGTICKNLDRLIEDLVTDFKDSVANGNFEVFETARNFE